MKFVKIFCGYCSVWKVCFLILEINGSKTEMMVPTVESGRMEKKNTNPFTNTSNHKALKNFSKPSTRRKENPNIKKKKKKRSKHPPSITTGWNRSKRCKIPPYYQQIKCIKQLKCIKYLRIGEKTEKEVNGGESRCSSAVKNTLRSGWRGLAKVGSVSACVRRWGQGRGFFVFGAVMVWSWSDLAETWWREPLLSPSKVAPGVTSLWPWVSTMCVYLPKCHENSGSFGNIVLVKLFVFLEIRVDEKVCENTCNIV